jgi:hypothetical protein
MANYSIKKNFANIGEIEYKLASNKEEMEGALALVYKEYLMRGFILPKFYRSGLRLTLHNIVPGATVFIALKDKEIVGAVTLFPDSPLGLPMDEKYKEEADALRRQSRKICEVGQLATKSGLFGPGLFSMFNFKKLDFVFSLFKMVFQYALSTKKFDDICVVVNPKALLFKFLLFEEMGEIKYYGFDRISINPKPAVAKRLDLRKVLEKARKKQGLYKIFLGEILPEEVFQRSFFFEIEDLKDFFVKKTDLYKKASAQEKKYILSAHKIKEQDLLR